VSASDLVDSNPSISCTPGTGSDFPISSTGTIVKCTASDHNSPNPNTSAQKTFTVLVQYDRAKISFPLAPLNKDGTSVYKLGSNIPTQFKATFADGAPITIGTFTLKISKLDPLADYPINEQTSTDAVTSGDSFRYTTDGIWKYNVATKTLGAGDFLFKVDLNDGSGTISKAITTTDGSPGQVKVGIKK
jgi:hypothetical protein